MTSNTSPPGRRSSTRKKKSDSRRSLANGQALRAAQQRWSSSGKPSEVLTLGLDLSLTGTGVVLWQEDGHRVRAHRRLTTDPADLHGRLPLPPKVLPSGKFRGNDEQRINWITRRIEWLCRRYLDHIGLVVIEDHAFGKQTNNASGVHELHGAVKDMLCTAQLVHITQSVGTVKKFATGSGDASKLEMIGAAKPYFPRVYNDDEADALHLARLGHLLLTGPEIEGALKSERIAALIR